MKKNVLILTAICLSSPFTLMAEQKTSEPTPKPSPTPTAISGKADTSIASGKSVAKSAVVKKSEAAVSSKPEVTPTPVISKKPSKEAELKDSPTPKPKRFLWIFPIKKSIPKPDQPVVTPPKANTQPESAPKKAPVVEVKPAETPKPDVTPPPVKEAKKQSKITEKSLKMDDSVPFVSVEEKSVEVKKTTNDLIAQDAQEKIRYNETRSKALTDPEVLKLQEKTDTAVGDDQKTASKAYYKALFDKIRSLDPSLKERVDRTEASNLRRIEQGK